MRRVALKRMLCLLVALIHVSAFAVSGNTGDETESGNGYIPVSPFNIQDDEDTSQ
jgi:hypothetical protein